MNKTPIRIGSIAAAGTFAALTVVGGAVPANAATGSTSDSSNQCLVKPAGTTAVHHTAITHVNTTTTPGTEEVSHSETRWTLQVPTINEVSHQETQYFQVIPGSDEVSHQQWKYFDYVPGQEAITHLEYQFSQENPGQEEITHLEYQFSRTNPGQTLVQHDEYKYQKVTKSSHTESRYQKSIKVYTVEHKKIQIPSYGKDRDKLVTWLTSIGATHLDGDWWQLPDSIVAKAGINPFKVNPTGNVNMSAYGGPSVTVPYQITGIETYDTPPAGNSFVNIGNQTVYYTGGTSFSLNASDAIWVNTTTPPAGYATYGQPKTVQDPDTVTLYNGGNWTRDALPAGYTQTDHRVVVDRAFIAPFKEYLKADGTASPNAADAGWFRQSTQPGWAQEGSAKTVEDQKYIAPFEQWRTAAGTASPNVADAGWFTQSSFDGWDQYGDPVTKIDQQYVADQTFYLHRDDQGNLSQSTNEADASFFTSDEGVDLSVYTAYDSEKVVDHEAVAPKTVYLTEDANGVQGETEDVTQASWITLADDNNVNLTIWQQMVNLHGDPLVRTVIDQEAVPGYAVYYVRDGEPTRELGESNWITGFPKGEGWTLVDTRKVVDKAAVPPKTTTVTVVDKAAWDETVTVPATYEKCETNNVLAHTGLDIYGAAEIAGALLLLGFGAKMIRRHRNSKETL
jgi:hypothetical protein